VKAFDLAPGVPVVLFLNDPREKMWGVLLKLDAAGAVLRGFDLRMFDDWLRQERKAEEALIGPLTLFFPAGRIERLERDETVGPVVGYSDRFFAEAGRTVWQAIGWMGPVPVSAQRGRAAKARRSRAQPASKKRE
jgi:hypothetical protein